MMSVREIRSELLYSECGNKLVLRYHGNLELPGPWCTPSTTTQNLSSNPLVYRVCGAGNDSELITLAG